MQREFNQLILIIRRGLRFGIFIGIKILTVVISAVPFNLFRSNFHLENFTLNEGTI